MTIKYPLAGELQQKLTTHLAANPEENPYEVHSSSGLEQTFGSQDDAEAYADEIRGAGATRVAVKKRTIKLRPPRPPGAPPMHHAPRGLPPGVPNPGKKCDHAALKRDPKAWAACRLVGRQYTPADDSGPEDTIEMRDCPRCGSTLAVAVPTTPGDRRGKENPTMKNPGPRILRERWTEGSEIVIERNRFGYTGWLESKRGGGRLPISFGRDKPETMQEALELAKKFLRAAHGKTNPEETHDTTILGGMEGAIWVTSYASWVDEQSDAKRKRLSPGGGGNWEDVTPPAPASALLAAEDLYTMIERANGKTPGELLERAAKADGLTPGKITDAYAELFGHYLAMQAMGHGVTWFDDHAEFPLKTPRFEAHSFNGKSVEWSPRGSKGSR